ncbi:MAG: cytochrome c peroxidase [Planctomycetota bacterium]
MCRANVIVAALTVCAVATLTGGIGHTLEAATKRNRVLHLPEEPFRYGELPHHFQNPSVRRLDNTPPANPITDAGATLGRVLFYDTRLSINNTTSCSSCHVQRYAFSNAPRRVSTGHRRQRTDRNSPSLVETRFVRNGRLFWDQRAASLEDQVLMPIESPIEMGHDLTNAVAALHVVPEYHDLFTNAFGDPRVTEDRVARALAQFVRAMLSHESRYDEGLARGFGRDDPFPHFSRRENAGKALFMQRCATCHMPAGQDAVFSPSNAHNIGLDPGLDVRDLGVADVTFDPSDAGRFRSPSLRNIELTAPYMHDGRLRSLEAVVEHYSTGIHQHPNLDRRLRGRAAQRVQRGSTRGFNFSPTEKAALVAFLKTLTDRNFIRDERFADPFAAPTR